MVSHNTSTTKNLKELDKFTNGELSYQSPANTASSFVESELFDLDSSGNGTVI